METLKWDYYTEKFGSLWRRKTINVHNVVMEVEEKEISGVVYKWSTHRFLYPCFKE